MAEEIRTITDKSEYGKLFKYFSESTAYLKSNNGNIEVKFFSYSEEKAVFRVPQVKNLPNDCLFITRHGNHAIYAYMRFFEKQGEDTFIFIPVRFQIMTYVRQEGRKSIDVGGGKRLIFITNIIADFIMRNSLSLENKKVDKIKDTLKEDMDNAFKNMKIFLCSEGMNDIRMKHFLATRKTIFISDFGKQNSENDKEYNNYMNNIYAKDIHLKNKKDIVSEISVPLLYQSKMPYGYIQINGSTPYNEITLKSVMKFSIMINSMFSKHNIFSISNEKYIITNVSKNGFGIAFKDRKHLRFFKDNSTVYLEMILPGEKRINILAIVRHIEVLANRIITVGFQISDIDESSELQYLEFIESLE